MVKAAGAAAGLAALLAGARVSWVIAAVLAVCVAMLGVALHLATWVLAKDEGTGDMQEVQPASLAWTRLREWCSPLCRQAARAVMAGTWRSDAALVQPAAASWHGRCHRRRCCPFPPQISAAIRDGAEGYFRTQYGTIVRLSAVVCGLIFVVYLFRRETVEQQVGD